MPHSPDAFEFAAAEALESSMTVLDLMATATFKISVTFGLLFITAQKLPAPIIQGLSILLGDKPATGADANTPLLAALVLFAICYIAWHLAGFIILIASQVFNAVTCSLFAAIHALTNAFDRYFDRISLE